MVGVAECGCSFRDGARSENYEVGFTDDARLPDERDAREGRNNAKKIDGRCKASRDGWRVGTDGPPVRVVYAGW